MTTLEKILQEIDFCTIEFEAFGVCDDYISAGWVKDIIKKHLSCENHTETTRQSRDNDGMISIDDDRLWNILFEEACVDGQQAERIHNRLKEICSEPYKPPVESAEEKSMREREEFFKGGE